MEFGKPKYGQSKKTYFKLKDGTQTFGILPPLGKDKDDPVLKDGIWSVYYRVHYGYTNVAGKSRPFESSLVKNRKTNMVEVPDAAVERLEKLKGSLEAAKQKKDKKAIEALQKLVGAAKSRYNLDSNHYLNVHDLQGNVGILKLRHKAKQALDVVIRELRDKNIDPLSPDAGRYFTFTRTGTGNETAFAVRVYATEREVEGIGTVKVDVVRNLSQDIRERITTDAGELRKLFKKPTAAEIQQIVDESNLMTGASPNIDAILGYRTEEVPADSDNGDENAEETTNTLSSETTDNSEDSSDATSESGDSGEQAALLGDAGNSQPQNEQKSAKESSKPVETTAAKKTETKRSVPVNTPPPTTAENIAEMSDADFLKSIGVN